MHDGLDKVLEHIEDAKSKGAKVLVGGERGEGTIVQPTVLTNVSTDCVSPICLFAQYLSLRRVTLANEFASS